MGYYESLFVKYGSSAAAARAHGMAVTTFKGRLYLERARNGASRTVESDSHSMAIPDLPEERPPIDVILKRMEDDYEAKRNATDAAEWFEIKVRDNLPFGLMVWGDPHLDNGGADIPLLRHHMRLAKHPAVFSLNIGDTLDGWVGRLARLYAESRIDVHTARELAMWFMREVRWLLWLSGNHDRWENNETALRLMSQQADVKLLSWQAKFRLTFPNGNDVRVHAAHDFPGRSIHNIVHANMRAARLTSPADLILSGHLHDWGSSTFEMAGFNRVPVSVRVAGYKRIDSYAMQGGFQSARWGSTCLVIIDPNMEGPGRITPMWDIDQGIFVLEGLIARYKAGARGNGKAAPDPSVLRVRAPSRKATGNQQAVRGSRKTSSHNVNSRPRAGQAARSTSRGKGLRRSRSTGQKG